MSTIHHSTVLPSGLTLELAQGDLTLEPLDAIVNPANRFLAHGGGVAGAIVRRGGRVIQEESDAYVRAHGPIDHAAPAVTGAGSLACRHVIHAVGPVWGEGGEDSKLAAAVRGSLSAAERLHLVSIALPAISTGIFGFPLQRAAGIILTSVCDWAAEHPASSLRLVRMTLLDEPALEVFHSSLQELSI